MEFDYKKEKEDLNNLIAEITEFGWDLETVIISSVEIYRNLRNDINGIVDYNKISELAQLDRDNLLAQSFMCDSMAKNIDILIGIQLKRSIELVQSEFYSDKK